jgi:hypothetical protein
MLPLPGRRNQHPPHRSAQSERRQNASATMRAVEAEEGSLRPNPDLPIRLGGGGDGILEVVRDTKHATTQCQYFPVSQRRTGAIMTTPLRADRVPWPDPPSRWPGRYSGGGRKYGEWHCHGNRPDSRIDYFYDSEVSCQAAEDITVCFRQAMFIG